MPVVLENPYVPSVPSFDKIHLDHITISLEKTQYAKAQIQARLRPYYQDPVTGEKTFSTETFTVNVDDAEAFAIELAQQGDMRGVSAMNNIKEIIGFLVETKTSLGITQIT